MSEGVTICMLEPANAELLDNVAPGVFDQPVDPRWSAEFLRDERHHLVMAVSGGQVIGIASAVHYVHPDKRPELWINEVAVAPMHRRRGIAKSLIERLCRHGRDLGCAEAWVVVDRENAAAIRLYERAGGVSQEAPSGIFSFRLEG